MSNLRRIVLATAFGVGLASVSVAVPDGTVWNPAAAQTVVPAPLTDEDRKELRRIERYMNRIDTMTARFVQISDEGRYSEGKVWVSRPGKLRFEYEPPVPILIVANGGDLMYHDSELQQTSYVGIDETPLEFLLRKRVAFGDTDITVTGMNRQPGIIQVEVVQTDNPDQGALILSFNDTPLELRKWEVIDSQGVRVNVALFNTKIGGKLDRDLFNMADPAFINRTRD